MARGSAKRRADGVHEAVGVAGGERQGASVVVGELRQPAGPGHHQRRPDRGGLQGDQAERLVQARGDGQIRSSDDRAQVLLADPPEEPDRAVQAEVRGVALHLVEVAAPARDQ